MKHLMVDIETLDTRHTAVVLSVGYCTFNRERVDEPKQFLCELTPQMVEGRTVSADTIRWWMGQPDEARKAVFDPDLIRTSRADLIGRLRLLLGDSAIGTVWAHGATFDIPILTSYLGVDLFDFRSIRDTRTLAMLAPDVERSAPLIKHHAGYDAEAQAKWVRDMMRHLGREDVL